MELDFTEHCLERLKERNIKREWLIQALMYPFKTEPDAKDPTLTVVYKPIPENGDRVLKVVYNKNTNPWTIITVHFHRSMTQKHQRGEL